MIGVIYDEFDVGNGVELEFVQATAPANALISEITDRMPLILEDEGPPVWPGDAKAGEDQVRALIRTEVFVEDPPIKPPRPSKPKG